jgi:hypothetical protein
MKFLPLRLPVLMLAGFLFTSCYTQFNATSQDDQHQAAHVEDGWFEIDGAYFYIDYTTRHWYSYYGIDLATDRRFLRMAHFRYHHPSSTYFYSPFRGSYFYNYPGYSNNFFYRIGLSPWNDFYAFHHPPFYSNPYMYSFYYNRWAHWNYWQSAFPIDWAGSVAHSTSGSQDNRFAHRSTGLSSGGATVSARNRGAQASSRLSADRSGVFEVTPRDRINLPTVEPIAMNERQRNLRDRRDAEYRDRLERNRAVRSPLRSWNSWEQRNNHGDRVQNRTRSTARSSGTVNRSGTSRSTGGSAVRGTSSRGGSSGSATRSSGSSRSSGDSSSSRGSN